ncbi:dTDP-4-dehydrorhamnose reductase [Pollutimonas sp. M17]|uniref:dTDP-4-dehydrorhamnose reductase n=1 Tax=Pollutimonas sp. M17 TaxID=2962065 RepID=UPI0021F42BFA|nr:dTDP-4-dehydrorhamnose reductase [Pollutimonas sp. M17]UYO93915.1 dTDP-4-dehydrorhamnose reductase [Pollutimonas sp. M17]
MNVVLTGASGQLGRCLHDRLPADWDLAGLTRAELDITDGRAVARVLARLRPDCIVNAAAYTAVDQAEREPDAAMAVNEQGARHLARAACDIGARLIHISTDYVFDGHASRPYAELDSGNPLNAYGRSKLLGERALRQACPSSLVLRTSWLYSEYGGNFVKTMLRMARAAGTDAPAIRVVNDQFGCPTYAGDLADAVIRLAGSDPAASGIYHYCGADVMSWHGFAQEVFDCAGRRDAAFPVPRLVGIAGSDYPSLARRPAYSALSCEKIEALGMRRASLRDALPKVLARLI